MNSEHSTSNASSLTRRSFLAHGSAALLGGAVLPGLSTMNAAQASGADTIKIALIGCGKRGSGAASQALTTTGQVKLVAMADVSAEQMNASHQVLQQKLGTKVEVAAAHQFTGFDGYKEAIALCDVAILTAPPGFRPLHFEEAVRQGKHVFMEKPVAVDAPGVRRILAAAAEAKQKGLKVGVGLQRRHKPGYIEAVKRIQDGACGELHTLQCNWLGSAREGLERLPGETEMQYQIRNWYFYTWLSGDHIVEQHVHNIDVIHWIKGTHPIRAQGMGGRQVRTGKIHGHIFDHHFVEYEYADGSRCFSQSRQIRGIYANISERVVGSKGSADLMSDRNLFKITAPTAWRYGGDKHDAYQLEHDDLFEAIRKDKPYAEAELGAISTMIGIMGRMATYSGKVVEWDEAFNSKLELVPARYAWDAAPPILPNADGFYPATLPGRTIAL
ncbi:MAG: Gfo/Idh/MocA family oxidoreductase [Verrucomicrobia bacterium]|nr:Gfo/Idh/MocA family oxidoreductase [Verrucomicrobiota bacterium]